MRHGFCEGGIACKHCPHLWFEQGLLIVETELFFTY